MAEKFVISPEAAKIFTPEQLKKIADGAEASKRVEAKRAGDYVEYAGPGPEEFGGIDRGADRINLSQADKIKSRPRSEFKKRAGAENYGWLNAWQDKNEIDRGKRRIIK